MLPKTYTRVSTAKPKELALWTWFKVIFALSWYCQASYCQWHWFVLRQTHEWTGPACVLNKMHYWNQLQPHPQAQKRSRPLQNGGYKLILNGWENFWNWIKRAAFSWLIFAWTTAVCMLSSSSHCVCLPALWVKEQGRISAFSCKEPFRQPLEDEHAFGSAQRPAQPQLQQSDIAHDFTTERNTSTIKQQCLLVDSLPEDWSPVVYKPKGDLNLLLLRLIKTRTKSKVAAGLSSKPHLSAGYLHWGGPESYLKLWSQIITMLSSKSKADAYSSHSCITHF